MSEQDMTMAGPSEADKASMSFCMHNRIKPAVSSCKAIAMCFKTETVVPSAMGCISNRALTQQLFVGSTLASQVRGVLHKCVGCRAEGGQIALQGGAV